jgi:hypothetical protein
MKSRLVITSFVALLVALIATPVFAVTTIDVPDGVAGFWVASGTKNTSALGMGNHAFWYYSATGGNTVSWGRWLVQPSRPPSSVNLTFWAWIPMNGLPNDAVVKYYICTTDCNVYKVVDQESVVGWTLLGTRNGNDTSSLWLDNYCVSGWACNAGYQVWWDDMQYQY